jgi:NADH:ubiquinone reductase (H+-translocating)
MRATKTVLMQPYAYRDFGSLVSVGKWTTVGTLTGYLSGRGIIVEGVFAGIMYRSLRLLHGIPRAVLSVVVRALAPRRSRTRRHRASSARLARR